jgi:hypothetical protein
VVALAFGLAAALAGAAPEARAGAAVRSGGAPKPAVRSPLYPTSRPPAGFGSWEQVYLAQRRLDAAATRIAAAGDGNASIVVDVPGHLLRVYWHGPVPAAVRALATRLGRRLGIAVRLRPAAFAFRALVAAARRVAAIPGVVEAAPRPVGAGLAVTITRIRTARPAGLRRLLSQAAGPVPLAVTTGPAMQPIYNRFSDTPPFWGGSRYSSSNAYCTNGFPLMSAAGYDYYMISAGHCVEDQLGVFIPGQLFPTGTAFFKVPCRDTALIDYSPNTTGGHVYIGPWNSADEVPVDPFPASDFVGDLVHEGGEATGGHLNLTVEAVDVFFDEPGNSCSPVGPAIQAGYSDGSCAAAAGDSGGPVYDFPDDGNARARGVMIAANLGTATCASFVTVEGGDTILYAPFQRPDGDPEIGALQFYDYFLVPG